MPPFDTKNLIVTDARHLPIVKAYARKIGLVETIDRMVDSQMRSLGTLLGFTDSAINRITEARPRPQSSDGFGVADQPMGGLAFPPHTRQRLLAETMIKTLGTFLGFTNSAIIRITEERPQPPPA